MNIGTSFKLEKLCAIAPDVSPRRYYRGEKGGRSYILMTYPDFNEAERANLHSFLKVQTWLKENALRVPEIYEVREDEGAALLEDLGETSLRAAMQGGLDQRAGYLLAGDILRRLKDCPPPGDLPPYKGSKIDRNHKQIIEFYAPLLRGGEESGPNLFDGYARAWAEIEHGLPECPQGFVHGDYHLENLMWLGQGAGVERLALIDFQEALHGPLPYDLVNLLEDARADVPKDIRAGVKARYCEGMSADERAAFDLWYRALGTQFHCRVIGLFIKLAKEGRPQYAIHLSRLQNYIRGALEEPLLLPLKNWFEEESLDFSDVNVFNVLLEKK